MKITSSTNVINVSSFIQIIDMKKILSKDPKYVSDFVRIYGIPNLNMKRLGIRENKMDNRIKGIKINIIAVNTREKYIDISPVLLPNQWKTTKDLTENKRLANLILRILK